MLSYLKIIVTFHYEAFVAIFCQISHNSQGQAWRRGLWGNLGNFSQQRARESFDASAHAQLSHSFQSIVYK